MENKAATKCVAGNILQKQCHNFDSVRKQNAGTSVQVQLKKIESALLGKSCESCLSNGVKLNSISTRNTKIAFNLPIVPSSASLRKIQDPYQLATRRVASLRRSFRRRDNGRSVSGLSEEKRTDRLVNPLEVDDEATEFTRLVVNVTHPPFPEEEVKEEEEEEENRDDELERG
ncbi:hypothetical protein K0M31_011224 [Melipona bicolor]|uniref:Uncharacterized protein n=1 Tax=Melipona bicolor TaxID=60889 RepID=A0AA40G945_9HYME|nr:hypothetical protein K0M31_011224 [Melipona bicolor]